MTTELTQEPENLVAIKELKAFSGTELDDLCHAVEMTMEDTVGFSLGFSQARRPVRQRLENYFKGVLVIPERTLFVGMLDGTIAGSIQLVRPPKSNETSDFAVSVDNHFVAPWARGHHIASKLLDAAEKKAISEGFELIKLSVRASRAAAIHLYERSGYTCWGVLDKYERVGDEMIAGRFYYKELT